ncbi:hypothetical protein [Qingshengfaniella alkalisoli]|uniref:Uncharacterized protein n=1 Tax=Qingshengfaniella alkalisoli TaxID=2599296 RepID=A0A5B8IBG0_9RHOB|nr:hypothetical protein [Qingshengfaniella alkalisoli]QDY70766.1 hypothetical protein FPZ52_13695 [Qingshengfaniella alkalisoli]
MKWFSVLLLIGLAACGRELSISETRFLSTVHGDTIATRPIRIHDGALIGAFPITRPARPWVTCRERIFPQETQDEIETSIFGVVLGNHMFVAQKFFSEDFLAGYPDALPLAQAMIVAHEMTHVWQWQNRATTGYAPWKAATEHAVTDDPYLFDVEDRDLLDYPYEQQASLIEEFVCCRALDPEGARTDRLHSMLSRHFPNLPRRSEAGRIIVPWNGVEPKGICS